MDDKIKILIASVLKPADDVRSCYKIGQSLAQTNKYEVNIIGFESKKKVESENIFLHPLFTFKRNSFKRLQAPLIVLKKYIKLKPQLIMVNTPELLWVMYIIKILFGTKIIYDIQENYQFNIKQNKIYKGLFKILILNFVKLNEAISKYLIDGFILAEEIYENQLNFIQNKPFIKLLNKTIINLNPKLKTINFSKDQSLNFIYSGTIGKEYGTLEAIEFCLKSQKQRENITLNIIGYSADKEYLKKVQETIKDYSFIHLKTDNKPIPQSKIISEIKKSNIALLPYQLNPNISGRFPTKIYDYLAIGIPMLIPPHAQWKAYIDQYQAGICTDFNNPDIDRFMQKLSTTTFYKESPKDEIQWKGQEMLLIEFIKKILSK